MSLCNDFLYYVKEWKDFGGRVIGASLDEENISIPIEQYQVRHPTLLIIGLYCCRIVSVINWNFFNDFIFPAYIIRDYFDFKSICDSVHSFKLYQVKMKLCLMSTFNLNIYKKQVLVI